MLFRSLDALRFARTLTALRGSTLEEAHARRRTAQLETWARAVGLRRERDPLVLERATSNWRQLAGPIELQSAPPLLARKMPTAREAGALAMTKLRVELPILNALDSLNDVVAQDTARNRHVLHRQVHEHFERGVVGDWRELSDWVYEALFLMPPSDPWLGLAPDDAFSAIERGGMQGD